MSKNNQFINKPILITSEESAEVNEKDLYVTLRSSENIMLTDYNGINKYLDEHGQEKTHTVIKCPHSIDKDENTSNVITLPIERCDFLHSKSPVCKIVLLKQNIVPNHVKNSLFKSVQLGIIKIPKPTKPITANKGKCAKRKKNIVK